MEWVLLAASVIWLAGSVTSYRAAVKRQSLIDALNRHTAEVKRQNEMLSRAKQITVVGVREAGEGYYTASPN
jgi:hypothetical protein